VTLDKKNHENAEKKTGNAESAGKTKAEEEKRKKVAPSPCFTPGLLYGGVRKLWGRDTRLKKEKFGGEWEGECLTSSLWTHWRKTN